MANAVIRATWGRPDMATPMSGWLAVNVTRDCAITDVDCIEAGILGHLAGLYEHAAGRKDPAKSAWRLMRAFARRVRLPTPEATTIREWDYGLGLWGERIDTRGYFWVIGDTQCADEAIRITGAFTTPGNEHDGRAVPATRSAALAGELLLAAAAAAGISARAVPVVVGDGVDEDGQPTRRVEQISWRDATWVKAIGEWAGAR